MSDVSGAGRGAHVAVTEMQTLCRRSVTSAAVRWTVLVDFIPQSGPGEMGMAGKTMKGTVKWFDVKKGHVFIIQNDGEDMFVHHSAILTIGYTRTTKDFEIEQGKKGPQKPPP